MTKSTKTKPAISPSAAPLVIWGDLVLTDEDVIEFRAALAQDVPVATSFADDEIRRMAYDSIHFVALITGLTSAAAPTHP